MEYLNFQHAKQYSVMSGTTKACANMLAKLLNHGVYKTTSLTVKDITLITHLSSKRCYEYLREGKKWELVDRDNSLTKILLPDYIINPNKNLQFKIMDVLLRAYNNGFQLTAGIIIEIFIQHLNETPSTILSSINQLNTDKLIHYTKKENSNVEIILPKICKQKFKKLTTLNSLAEAEAEAEAEAFLREIKLAYQQYSSLVATFNSLTTLSEEQSLLYLTTICNPNDQVIGSSEFFIMSNHSEIKICKNFIEGDLIKFKTNVQQRKDLTLPIFNFKDLKDFEKL
jgi:hypothetical protein